MLQTIRRWVRNGIAPLALAALSVAAGCHSDPYWEGRPMAGPKNPTCYPDNEWGGYYPTCWRQWPECAPRCKKDTDVAATVDEGTSQSSPPFTAETPVPAKPKAAPDVGVPKKPAVNPETPASAPAAKPAGAKPPAPAKTSSDESPAQRDSTEPVGDVPAMEDEATGGGQDDGWLIVEDKARPAATGQTNRANESPTEPSRDWKPRIRQTSGTEYLRAMQDSPRGPAFR
jgi:hypothetical protein